MLLSVLSVIQVLFREFDEIPPHRVRLLFVRALEHWLEEKQPQYHEHDEKLHDNYEPQGLAYGHGSEAFVVETPYSQKDILFHSVPLVVFRTRFVCR